MRIFCFGDSNTWGHKKLGIRYDNETRWTMLLGSILGDGYTIIEDGLCGRTADSLQEDADRPRGFLQRAIVSAYPFDVVIISLGLGDLRADLKFSTEQIAENLGKVVKTILEYDYEDSKTPTIIIGAPPHIKSGVSSSKDAYIYGLGEDAVEKSKQFSELYKKLADELGVYFFDESNCSEVSDEDCRHLTAEGHKKLAHGLADFIKSIEPDIKMNKVLCFGDSITWSYKELGIRYPKEVRWTTIVENILGESYTIIEDGLPGRPTDDPEFFLKALKKHEPFDLIFIMLGSSDLKTSINLSPRELADNLARYAKMALEYEYKDGKTPSIVIAAPPRVKEGVSKTEFAHFIGMNEEAVEKAKELAPLYKEKASELGIYFFDAGLYCEGGKVDHFHLDEEGHQRLGEEVAKFLETL